MRELRTPQCTVIQQGRGLYCDNENPDCPKSSEDPGRNIFDETCFIMVQVKRCLEAGSSARS